MIDYPKKGNDNYAYRAELLSHADTDPQFRAALVELCRRDILFWINSFCWIYDAKGDIHAKLGYSSPHMPFITFPFQDDYILRVVDHIERGEDLLTEKSRDMGASWMILTIFLWFWNFQGPGNDFLCGSRKMDYVDKADNMSSLFPKLRYQLDRQPEWLLPVGFTRSRHDSFCRLVNPADGNTIIGESNNDNFGTSGRVRAIMKDEYAKWKHTDAMAWQSTADTTNCRLPVSSAWGRNNKFYRLAKQKEATIQVATLHWRIHPLKDEEWYAAEKKRRNKQELAAEVDIDYTASITDKAYEAFSFAIHCAEPYPVLDPNLPLILMCDFNITPMSWAIAHEVKGETWFVDEISEPARTQTAPVIEDFCKRYIDHKQKSISLYGDATGKRGDTRSKTNDWQIIKDTLRRYQWEVVSYIPTKNPGVKDSLTAANKRFRDYEEEGRSWVRINPDTCPNLVDSLEQTQRKDDGIDKSDNIEHMTDGPRYYFNYRFPIARPQMGGIQT